MFTERKVWRAREKEFINVLEDREADRARGKELSPPTAFDSVGGTGHSTSSACHASHG